MYFPDHYPDHYPEPRARVRDRRIAFALIVALHAAFLLGWHDRVLRSAAAPERVMTAWMVPTPPKRVALPQPVARVLPRRSQPLRPHLPQQPPQQQLPISAAEQAPPAPPSDPLTAAAPAVADAPALDREKLKQLARTLDTDAVRSAGEKSQQRWLAPHNIESTVADAARRGARKDCQTAYTGMGVLAIIPLVFGTVTDKGCKWK